MVRIICLPVPEPNELIVEHPDQLQFIGRNSQSAYLLLKTALDLIQLGLYRCQSRCCLIRVLGIGPTTEAKSNSEMLLSPHIARRFRRLSLLAIVDSLSKIFDEMTTTCSKSDAKRAKVDDSCSIAAWVIRLVPWDSLASRLAGSIPWYSMLIGGLRLRSLRDNDWLSARRTVLLPF